MLAAIEAATARYNSQVLWGAMPKPQEPSHVTQGIGRDLIREALKRALYDAEPRLFEGFRHTVIALENGPAPCDAPRVLARAMARELSLLGYEMKSDRHNPAPNRITARIVLEDHLWFGIDHTARCFRETLDSLDRAEAGTARAEMTAKIMETFTLMRVVLGRLADARQPPAS